MLGVSEFVGFCLSTCLLKIVKEVLLKTLKEVLNGFEVWGVFLTQTLHVLFPVLSNSFWMVGRSFSWRMLCYQSLLTAVFLGKVVREPLAEDQSHA